jgi:hypothetical protein
MRIRGKIKIKFISIYILNSGGKNLKYKGENRMRIPDNLAMILLALYLILDGILRLFGSGIGIAIGLLALAAGILLLLQYIRR